MRTRVGLALLAVLAAVSACAPKTVALPVVAAPRFPEFVKPNVPADLVFDPAAMNQERAWIFLQAGDIKNADREVTASLKRSPAFYPAEATGGYVELAQKDAKSALTRFDRALAGRSTYAPALFGKGEALVALNREEEAIEAFRSALAADASLSDLARRIEVLKFRTVQRDVAAARQAAGSGKIDDALEAYRVVIAHSPDTGFLYRELAMIERKQGDGNTALEHFRKAADLDPSDTTSLVQIAELLEARDDVDGALAAYARALALEPDARLEARRNALLTRLEMASLPEQYRAIEAAAQITRGDLAALVGIRLATLLEVTSPRDVGVITDIRGHWAEPWILAVTRSGILDAFANHTFQPRSVVRRVDFAQAITRLLAKVALVAPTQARKWANARGRFTDIAAGHLAYPAASSAIAAGVMTTTPEGAFEPTRVVTGIEAIETLENVRAMADLPSSSNPARR
jgi:tetratricopeptide (TPR) repeat protein